MIEMDEQFQREFGAAMAQLRALHVGFTGSAENARGEARSIAASEDPELAVTAYEASHAYWTAAERLRPILASFEDADRRAAYLVEQVDPKNPLASATPVWLAARVEQLSEELATQKRATEVFQQRTHFLEGQLARLNTALGASTADTEVLIDAVIRALTGQPFEFESLAEGTLIAGEWVGAAGVMRKLYVGRFQRLDEDGPVISYVCECGNGDGPGGHHVVSTRLNPGTVRLPTADEILAFDAKVKQSGGLLALSDASDE